VRKLPSEEAAQGLYDSVLDGPHEKGLGGPHEKVLGGGPTVLCIMYDVILLPPVYTLQM
jgi:hypothetical protein